MVPVKGEITSNSCGELIVLSEPVKRAPPADLQPVESEPHYAAVMDTAPSGVAASDFPGIGNQAALTAVQKV